MEKPDPFLELWKPHRNKVFYGGRGSGKSWAVAEALVVMASVTQVRVLCVREVQSSIRDSSYQILKDTAVRLGLDRSFQFLDQEIRHRGTLSRFMFKGLYRNEQSIKSTEGVDICWVEEAQTVTAKSWGTLIPTIRKEGSEIWITFNPLMVEDPVKRIFIDNPPPDTYIRKVNYDENPHFPAALRKEMEHDKKVDYDNYLHVWEGEPQTKSCAQVFRGHYTVQEFPEDLWRKADRLFFGADFGFANDPSTLIRSFILDDRLYIEYEAYGTNVEIDELPQLYAHIPESMRWSIKCDCSRPETISYLRNRAVLDKRRVSFNTSPAEKWQGCIEDGIAYLKGFDQIVIHPRCIHTAEEFKMYSYKQDPKTDEILPVVIDKWNHCIDAIRYSLDGYITKSGLEAFSALGRDL